MGANLQWSQVRERAAGKWQIPALLAAAVCLGLSIATYRTPSEKIPFDEIRDSLPSLIDQGMYTAAIESAQRLLLVPHKTPHDLAPIRAAIGRARLLRVVRNGAQVVSIGRESLKRYEEAEAAGYEPTALDDELIARAHDWMGEYKSAVQRFDAARSKGGASDLELRRRMVEIRADKLAASPSDVRNELDGLIDAAASDPKILTWAVGREIDLLFDADDAKSAQELLSRTAEAFESAGEQRWLEYFTSYVLHHAGADDEAEARLRALRAGLKLRDDLYTRTGWLLGRVLLGGDEPGRPEEAMSFFREVLSIESSPVYAAASELGMAEALVLLERFDEALERYEVVQNRMRRLPPSRPLNPAVMESSLTVLAERLRRADQVEAALRFARLAAEIDPTADAARQALFLGRLSDLMTATANMKQAEADALVGRRSGGGGAVEAGMHAGAGTSPMSKDVETARDLRDQASKLLLESASIQERIAGLTMMDERRSAAAAWAAAEQANQSGDARAAIEAMRRFIQTRPESVYASRALRYLGQAQQALGEYGKAVESFQENLDAFPRMPDAVSTLIPMARCYMAMGPKYAEQAEKTLRTVLDDSEVFTPQAPEYADALYLLGDLLNRTGEYERAIPILEETMVRYPTDDRSARAQFLLGDCYRQSGLALKEEYEKAAYSAQREQILADQQSRLRRAGKLFAETIALLESRSADRLSERDQVYLRHSRLYEADCHFELREYDKAQAQYERAAWLYKGTTTMLASYVQIINCHVFKGDGPEAGAAIRRALYLVETMPDDAFKDGVDIETREDWKSYFQWVAKSELF